MISIIIVNYNSEKHLSKCIESIINSDINNIKIEVIIINNNCHHGNLSKINQSLNIREIDIGNNIGYSKAINIGIGESIYPTIITMNPDVVINTDSIPNMYNYFNNNNNIGVLGCKVLNTDKSFQLSSRRKFPALRVIIPYLFKFHYLGFTNSYNYMNLCIDKIHFVDSVSGAFMMFSKKVYNLVEGFDERFFLYFEDTDFCIKANKIGYNIIYYPDAEIIHNKYGSRNYLNYLFIKLNFYLSFLKFIYKYKGYFFINLGIRK
jgi:hypothetical protein